MAKDSNKGQSIKDILLADYNYLQTSFWKNEEVGEKRVEFFIAIATAVLSGLAVLLAASYRNGKVAEITDLVVPIAIFSLLWLLFFGLITLLRLLKRNEVTDGYKIDMDRIRERYKDIYDVEGALSDYSIFRAKRGKAFPIRKIGGLAHSIAVANGIIVAALALILVLALSKRPVISAIVSIVCFLFATGIQFAYISRRDRYSKNIMELSWYSHAGAIVYQTKESTVQFLIITVKNNRNVWVLPKGHVNRDVDMNLRETALRGVQEETGINAQVICPVGSAQYQSEGEKIRVRFFLMKYLRQVDEQIQENRTLKWVSIDEAAARLSFRESIEIVETAHLWLENMSKKKRKKLL
jgi:8-oxo-dGTP pyrophosphatase MutT (NUDIX family)